MSQPSAWNVTIPEQPSLHEFNKTFDFLDFAELILQQLGPDPKTGLYYGKQTAHPRAKQQKEILGNVLFLLTSLEDTLQIYISKKTERTERSLQAGSGLTIEELAGCIDLRIYNIKELRKKSLQAIRAKEVLSDEQKKFYAEDLHDLLVTESDSAIFFMYDTLVSIQKNIKDANANWLKKSITQKYQNQKKPRMLGRIETILSVVDSQIYQRQYEYKRNHHKKLLTIQDLEDLAQARVEDFLSEVNPVKTSRRKVAEQAQKELASIIEEGHERNLPPSERFIRLYTYIDGLSRRITRRGDIDITIPILNIHIAGSRLNRQLKGVRAAMEGAAAQFDKDVGDSDFKNAIKLSIDHQFFMMAKYTFKNSFEAYEKAQEQIKDEYYSQPIQNGYAFFKPFTKKPTIPDEEYITSNKYKSRMLKMRRDVNGLRDKEPVPGGVTDAAKVVKLLKFCETMKNGLVECDATSSLGKPSQNTGFAKLLNSIINLVRSFAKHSPTIANEINIFDKKRALLQKTSEASQTNTRINVFRK